MNIVSAIAMLALSSGAINVSAERTAMREWDRQNELCRGSPDARTIHVACPLRERIGRELYHRGWCYAYSDWRIMPQEYRWHRCSEETK